MNDNQRGSGCPVCGFPDVAAYDEHGCATFEICPCCGIEFGYDDATTSHSELRARWIAGGKRWWSERERPPGWDADAQLARIGE
ncbi:hypothetical protein KXS07_17825 [Inquilinus limosus]|uniref:hypothetical protein n=1 Tax=Inquilinus limosus TaxID=171674 RepID=UPI003F15E6BD